MSDTNSQEMVSRNMLALFLIGGSLGAIINELDCVCGDDWASAVIKESGSKNQRPGRSREKGFWVVRPRCFWG